MGERKTLLVVAHSRTGGTRRLVEAVTRGAREAADGEVDVREVAALEARAPDVRTADAVLVATPENFGALSGAMKHFFDESYDDLLGETEGLPWAMVVKAGNDGSGAVRQARRIVTGLRWREVQEPLVVAGPIRDEHLDAARELGGALAAGLGMGIF